MSKKILTVILFLAFSLCLTLYGCSDRKFIGGIELVDTDVIEMEVGEFKYADHLLKIKYTDGTSREVQLTEDMIPPIERMKFYQPSDETALVKVVYAGYEATLKVKVGRWTFLSDYSFEKDLYEFVYDGTPHKVTLSDNLPDGVVVDYPNGYSFTDVSAEDYEVIAVISAEGYVTTTSTAKVRITKADYDLNSLGIKFEDKTFKYDGKAKTLEIENLPKGFSATYTFFAVDENGEETKVLKAENAGEYVVKATITAPDDKNYNPIPVIERRLTIRPIVYDMEDVSLVSQEFVYDGTEKSIKLTGVGVLPDGVSVSYATFDKNGNPAQAINAGEYVVKATFTSTDKNHSLPSFDSPTDDESYKRARLKINKAFIDTDSIVFNSDYFIYDGNYHSLVCENVPSGIIVEYENNEHKFPSENRTVTAKFKCEDENNYYILTTRKTAVLYIEIREESVEFSDDNLIFREDRTVGVINVPEKYTTTVYLYSDYEMKNPVALTAVTEGVTYYFTVDFSYETDDDLGIRVFPVSGVWTPMRFDYDLESMGVTFENATVLYDGQPHTIEMKNLPDQFTVYYEYFDESGNPVIEAVKVGTYKIVAHVSCPDPDHYNHIKPIERTITIDGLKFDVSDIHFELPEEDFVYDGQKKTVKINEADLPEGLTVNYEYYRYGNSVPIENAITVGNYKVIATFTSTLEGYDDPDSITCDFVIKKRFFDLNTVKFEDANFTCDGQQHYLTVSGVPEGVSYEKFGDGETASGLYEVTLILTCDDAVNTCIGFDADSGTDRVELKARLRINKTIVSSSFNSSNISVDSSGKVSLINFPIVAWVGTEMKTISKENATLAIVDFRTGREVDTTEKGKQYIYIVSFLFDDENLNEIYGIAEVMGTLAPRF